MTKIEVKPNQTIFDIALEQYGTCEAVSEMLRNNPEITNADAAKVALGIDPVKDRSFYLDLSVRPGLKVAIDPDSRLMRKNVTREIQTDITTFDHGTND